MVHYNKPKSGIYFLKYAHVKFEPTAIFLSSRQTQTYIAGRTIIPFFNFGVENTSSSIFRV